MKAPDPVRRALLEAQAAGPILEPLEPLTDAELEASIELDVAAAVGAGETASPSGEVPPAASRPVEPAPAPLINGYRIVREIGSGGQGSVYLAEQVSTSRPVAIKVLPGGPFAQAQTRARFEREAAALAALDHPNVVRIVDRCRTADGSMALVMDYVDGRPIDRVVADRPPPENGARPTVLLFAAVADGVDEAHRRGIVHRDLKPSNVLVDRRGTPRVVDFGLARSCDGPTDTRVTTTGQMVGSLPWASPEQVCGAGIEALDARSDVYSLGVMLYRALTGQPPYPTQGSLRKVLDAIQYAAALPPHTLPAAQARGVDAALSAVVLKALAKRPGDRYVTAGEFARELRAWAAGHRTVAWYAVLRKAKRRRWQLVGVAAAIAVALSLAAVFAPFRDPRLPPATVTVMPLPQFTNTVGMHFVQIPPGRFSMGSDAEESGRGVDEAQREVIVSDPVWFATTEVTRGRYRAVMGGLPATATAVLTEAGDSDEDVPVDNVTWEEAQAFCQRLTEIERRTYRLPHEMEWEWAARAGSTFAWTGNGRPGDMGWHEGNSGHRLYPVGRKLPNAWGLRDVHGNVAEWCEDWYDPSGLPGRVAPPPRRVARGGSSYDPPERCRSAARAAYEPNEPFAGIGFRVVLTDADLDAAATQPQEQQEHPEQVAAPVTRSATD